MKTGRTFLLLICLFPFWGQIQSQSLVEVYRGTSLPTSQGWKELRFDNSMPWEQSAKELLVAPSELSAVAASALNLKANEVDDQYGFPLYSQLGWYKTHTGFSVASGFTVQFRAKVINSNGAFTVSGVGGDKGFRLEFSNNRLVEHANVLDTVRVLSSADNTDGFHTYHVAVTPNEKVYVWRDGALLGELPLQSFKLDNILPDGGFEKGGTPEEHGWSYTESGKPGTLTVSTDPAHVKTGKYGLFVDKGYHKNEFIPVKPGAIYDMTAWGKTITYPEGGWRDLCGWHDPAADRTVYFVADRNNLDWKLFEKKGMEGGAEFQRFILETPTSDLNVNQMAYDDMHYSERIIASRIPEGAVNLFPNGDFENPCATYFPAGDPRNDTCLVNPNNYRYSADTYYGGRADDDVEWFSPPFNAEHNAAPFWHPFWGSRVRLQYKNQEGNKESGPHWARGNYSLRFFNCFGSNVEYGNDFTSGQNEDRGSNSNIKTVPIELGANKTYTFLFSYHFAKWGGDHLILVVKNGTKELFRQTINNSEHVDWVNKIIEFTTDADNHALQILTERDGSTPGVLYLDDLFLFEGQLLPEDNTHLFFGKQTSVKGAEVEIEYIKIDNTGSFDPSGNFVGEQTYTKKTASLMTVWGEALQATGPILNEYPRPQLKRSNWTNLNGIWNFTRKTKDGFGTYNAGDEYRQEILVPFPVESALSGIMGGEYALHNKTYAYKRNAPIAKPADGKRVILNFGAVDWESYVFVNGTEVAHHKGGFDSFSADITDALNVSGNQEIVVQVFDPAKGGQPVGKQDPAPNGSWYTPASGIWQTVWTETVNPAYVTNLTLTPVDNAAVKVKVEAAGGTGATVKVFDGATQVGSAEVALGAETTIAISSPKLWSPESPFLYNVTVELKSGGATTDQVTSYFGLRKLEVKKLRGKPFIYLNDKETFNYATLDHGYFPDGIYTPASYDAIRFDLKKLKEIGFNAVRKFEKIEPAVWYHLADSIGLLVWQDIPAARTDGPYIPELNTPEARQANFLRETEAMAKSIQNFPSVVAWIGFNDGWGQYDYNHTKKTVDLLRSLNDGRLIVPESGGDSYELGDVVSSHGLPLPSLHANPYNQRASICGVTGKYDYVINGHVWDTSNASDIKNDSTYAARLKEFSTAAKKQTLNGMAGLAMVQTTDVEKEVNGLMTYDRKVYKAGEKADSVLKANIDFMKTKITVPILRVSAQGGELWKYKTGLNGAVDVAFDWNTNPGLDETGWLEGRSGFGSKMDWYAPNTLWKGDQIELYLRKTVHIPALEPGDKLAFSMAYDEDYEFYINGILAHSNTGWSTSYVTIEITPEAEAAINYGGDNLFAIHVIQNNGGSAMDLGLMADNLSNPIDYLPPVEPVVWKEIATVQEWKDISRDLNGFYRLTADIDMLTEPYTPIGNSDTPFRGYIDGQNFTVKCPEIKVGDRLGLFGYADGAHFVNLRLTDGYVEGGADVGILLGRGKGIHIEHIVFEEDRYPIQAHGRDHVGIVAGMLEGGKLSTIKDVYVVDGEVESTEWQAAGLVGIICDTRIINSYFTGTVAITHTDRLTVADRDGSGIASRTEGGKNFFDGVMSLASEVLSASGNEFISFNGGGYIVIDSATCFTRGNMTLDPLFNPDRGGQFARATESMKRPEADFKSYPLYANAGWDVTNVWGIPKGGGYPIFRTIPGAEFEDYNDVPKVEKISNNLKVYSIDGNIVLTATQPTAVWIYNLQGALVERIDFTGTQSIALPRGVYIVKSAANGDVKAVKVINR
jgi:hypothetical protein